MIYILLLILFVFLIPSIHFKEIVDEQLGQRQFSKFSVKNWKSPTMIYKSILAKIYGAWMFKTREMDRLSIILLHLGVVWLIDHVFGFKVALLWSSMPMTLFVGMWRNGRRYNLSVLLVLLVQMYGVVMYPLVAFTQVSAVPAILLTPFWAFAPLFYWPLRTKIKLYGLRVKGRARIQKVFRWFKLIGMVKTLSYFVYRTLVPQRIFMYESWFQSYGSHKVATREFFKKDKWFYSGFVLVLLLICGLFYEPTRLGCWWFLIFYAPFSNVVTAFQHNNTRYMILPAIGLWIVLAQVMPLWLCCVYASFQFMYMAMSVRMFMGNEEFYNYHFDHSPRSIAPYYIMAKHFASRGNYKEALAMLRRLFDLVPYHFGGLLLLLGMPVDDKNNLAKKALEELSNQTFSNRKELKSQIKNLQI